MMGEGINSCLASQNSVNNELSGEGKGGGKVCLYVGAGVCRGRGTARGRESGKDGSKGKSQGIIMEAYH